MVESFQESDIYIPANTRETLKVAELTFSVDTGCLAQFSANGRCLVCTAWLVLEGDSLSACVEATGTTSPLPIVYTYLIQPGVHTVEYKILGGYVDAPSTFRWGYLQALIFLPDTATDAVTEPTDQTRGLNPLPATSVISRGPYVTAPGATQVVDASGRVLEGVLSGDRIYLSDLPPGTYFARQGERTITKVVKVE